MARRKSTAEEDSTAPSFEEALAGLETIVEAMEHEQLPLEELVAYYEKGSVLLDRCEALLQSARQRIELITLRNQSEIEPDSASGSNENPAISQPSGVPVVPGDDDDVIRGAAAVPAVERDDLAVVVHVMHLRRLPAQAAGDAVQVESEPDQVAV